MSIRDYGYCEFECEVTRAGWDCLLSKEDCGKQRERVGREPKKPDLEKGGAEKTDGA